MGGIRNLLIMPGLLYGSRAPAGNCIIKIMQTPPENKQEKHAREPRLLGFYGRSNSGKTTLVERLVGDLASAGWRVAAVKVSEQAVSMDQPGKDSWRYAQAGARAVALAAQGETGILVRGEMDMRRLLEALALLGQPQLILVEGAREDFIPKVRLGEIELRANTLRDYDGDYAVLLDWIKELLQEKE